MSDGVIEIIFKDAEILRNTCMEFGGAVIKVFVESASE
jgi:hypothetical protein